ncbi:MAG: S9 family peptidase, partial [Planctomycetota bacterium]
MSIKTQWMTLALCGAALAVGSACAEESALIPRDVLFGNPERSEPQVSPDGAYISYLAPRGGVMNVFVAPRHDVSKARPITNDRKRGIRSYQWTHTGKDILYIQDADGDENWHVYIADIKTTQTRDLTPIDGVQGQIVSVNESFPERILVGINDRTPKLHDLYAIDLESGKRTLIEENPGTVAFLTDHEDQVRMALTFSAEGGMTWLEKTNDGWKPNQQIGPADALTTEPVGFNKAGDQMYVIDSRNRNTAALYAWNLDTGEKKLLAENERADVAETIRHPSTKEVQAVAFTYDRKQWEVLDDAVADDLAHLKTVEDGELNITSRTLDDRWWTVEFTLDNGPVKYYLYDSENKTTRFLFSNRDDLEGYTLAKMHPVEIPTRDGLTLVSYLTLPVDSDDDGNARPASPLPTVLFVHGGPWARDWWGFNTAVQLLANRGYAV